MGYICTSCLREYYADGLNLENSYGYNYKCPSIHCGDLSVVEIDDLMMSTIKELNKKGYITKFCCSGHSYEKNTDTYISFNSDTVPSTLPSGFILEDMDYHIKNNFSYIGDQLCIRKWYKEIAKEDLQKALLETAIELIDWVKLLPECK